MRKCSFLERFRGLLDRLVSRSELNQSNKLLYMHTRAIGSCMRCPKQVSRVVIRMHWDSQTSREWRYGTRVTRNSSSPSQVTVDTTKQCKVEARRLHGICSSRQKERWFTTTAGGEQSKANILKTFLLSQNLWRWKWSCRELLRVSKLLTLKVIVSRFLPASNSPTLKVIVMWFLPV